VGALQLRMKEWLRGCDGALSCAALLARVKSNLKMQINNDG
jgi:hypothetical protein